MPFRRLGTLVLMAAVAGCAHLSLKDKAVREIRVQTVAEPGLCNGQEGRIAVIAVMSDGSELATTGAGKGKVGWDNYQVSVNGGTSKDGKVTLSSDPRATWAGPATLLVVAADHAGVEWRGEIPVRYDCDVDADFSGPSGKSGLSGSRGSNGSDPGGDGGQGSDGSSGESGANGRTIEAWVTTVVGPGQKTLVQVVVEADTARSYYAFEPTHGRLTLRTTGGEGGKGGAGGDGGDGGNASKDGTTKQGSGGNGGDGDCGGDGADGGDVTLHVDPSARPYLDRIVINADGGDSGGGGDGGSGGKGSPRGRSGKGGCGGEGGHGGHTETVNETVAPRW